ncbi:MAG: hypothetical protein LBQ57_11435 [Spirochaetales bacterium]|jgi:hypothetical protein|nr:hypothetical protein [Spirochaetales bacterium]
MKKKQNILAGGVFGVLCVLAGLFSCASSPARQAFLPLADGWYTYNFERTLKGIQDEYEFSSATGMSMIQEITLKQNGTVTYCENGALFDPVLSILLSVADDGKISSRDNPSVSGSVSETGDFYWSGTLELHGRLNGIFIKGVLAFLPREERAGSEYDGLYHMRDTGTGRRQLVRVADGLYTWRYLDDEGGGEEGFEPWPTLIRPDGSFNFDMEITTALEMGALGRSDYSTAFFSDGKITAGKSISVREYAKTSGMGRTAADEAPHIYSGGLARQGEYPNEAAPDDAGKKIPAAVRSSSANRDWSQYPDWYLRPPQSGSLLYAAGEKTFADKTTALAMAEAAAAADIAMYRRMRVEKTSTAAAGGQGLSANTIVRSESSQKLSYKVVKSFYNENTQTAFVLVEAAP